MSVSRGEPGVAPPPAVDFWNEIKIEKLPKYIVNTKFKIAQRIVLFLYSCFSYPDWSWLLLASLVEA
jgi:hypothetical protein